MENHIPAITIVVILFSAMLVKGVFGFGDALIAMPLLAMVVGIKTATPLFAMMGTTCTLMMLIAGRQSVNVKSVKRLIAASFFGIPIGLFFLKGPYELIINLVLSLVIIFFSIYNLILPRFLALKHDNYAYIFGFLGGVLGGACNASGPPVIIYSALRRWPPASIRSTLQGYFLPLGIFIVVGHGFAGLWTQPVVYYYIISMPAVLVAIYLGGRLHRLIPVAKFERSIFILLIMIGLFLLAHTLAAT